MNIPEKEEFESLPLKIIVNACEGVLHNKAEEGVRLFNEKEYWHAHEALEEAWLDESGPVRQLYKGILQTGVAYLHVQRANFIGVMKMYKRSSVWLAPWPEHCRTIDVEKLRDDLHSVIQEARRLGPKRIDQLDQILLQPIHRVPITFAGK